MTAQEYKHIQNLAWLVLIDSGTNSLPIELSLIESLYKINTFDDNYFGQAIEISSELLSMYGMNCNYSGTLAIMILSPLIVLKEIGVRSAEDLSMLTGLPMGIAINRYDKLKWFMKQNTFKIPNLERKVLKQFLPWIISNY